MTEKYEERLRELQARSQTLHPAPLHNPAPSQPLTVRRGLLLALTESAEQLHSECLCAPHGDPERMAVLDELESMAKEARGVLGD